VLRSESRNICRFGRNELALFRYFCALETVSCLILLFSMSQVKSSHQSQMMCFALCTERQHSQKEEFSKVMVKLKLLRFFQRLPQERPRLIW
jgi:hypothetical protein